SIERLAHSAEVRENPLDRCGRLDAGDDAKLSCAVPAGFDVEGKDSLEALCPGHRRCLSVAVVRARWPRRADPFGTNWGRRAEAGANTPWYRVRWARGFGTSATSRAMKSSGSKITCVVPSR